MKKTIISSLIAIVGFTGYSDAQVLNIPEVIQEQNQWCWAGVSKSVLDYYGYHEDQCEIAEYARTVITWHSFGTEDCCDDPSQGCNYWNYNWGYPGSIKDILVHFGNVQGNETGNPITLAQVNTEINAGHPFIIRWGWSFGGGHFVVGHGVSNNDVYYMNPAPGEGLHIADYDWLKTDGTHTWTHTNRLTTNPSLTPELALDASLVNIAPNPSSGKFTITCKGMTSLEVTDAIGKTVLELPVETTAADIDLSAFGKGVYFVKVYAGRYSVIERLLCN